MCHAVERAAQRGEFIIGCDLGHARCKISMPDALGRGDQIGNRLRHTRCQRQPEPYGHHDEQQRNNAKEQRKADFNIRTAQFECGVFINRSGGAADVAEDSRIDKPTHIKVSSGIGI